MSDMKPLEQRYFEWEAFDETDTLTLVYYNATLIGDWCGFNAGERFSVIEIDYGSGIIVFSRDDENDPDNYKTIARYRFEFKICEQLPLEDND